MWVFEQLIFKNNLLYRCAVFVCSLTAVVAVACRHSSNTPVSPNSIKLNEVSVTKNILWASADGVKLTMDIYRANTAKSKCPVLVIYHGGGWLINTNVTMDSMSMYIAKHGSYIVCNVNYRLLGDNNNTVMMNELVEDAMGSLAWIKEHIAEYGGDSSKIVITGDSAGGHLAAMVLLAGTNLESDGFSGRYLGYKPTHLPPGKSAEQYAAEKGLEVQGAILSYAAFDIYTTCLAGMESSGNIFWLLAGKTPRGIFGDSINVLANPDYYKAVSPIYLIPNSTLRTLPPQLCIVGSADVLITPASVQKYVNACLSAGQKVEYWVHDGRPHAFLDSDANPFLGTSFSKDAPPALDKILSFLNRLFTK